jgi:hypothetical protein
MGEGRGHGEKIIGVVRPPCAGVCVRAGAGASECGCGRAGG